MREKPFPDLSDSLLATALAGRPFRYFASLGSTNDEATQWLKQGGAPGSVVIADQQGKGRGRLGRSWYAPAGTALMFSCLLRPEASELSYISMMGALVVCEAAEWLGAKVSLKWPNDVQVEGRKLCGVLPEATWQGSELAGVVLGVGINIRIDFTATPLAETAISLETVVGAVDRTALLARLLERLDFWSVRLASNELFNAWHSRLNMIGRRVSINHMQGIAEAVDRKGALYLLDDAGALHRVVAGDIALG